MDQEKSRTNKILILFAILFAFVCLLLGAIAVNNTEPRDLPSLLSSKEELAVRGDIVSSDNFTITTSKKLYKAEIDTRSLDPKKIKLFVKLFSIYSNIDEQKILKKIQQSRKNRPGSVVLSYNIDSKTAKNLKTLAYNLRRLGVFQTIQTSAGKLLYGLSITKSGEKRLFTYADTLTPVIGYNSKYESENGTTKVRGIKGLERYYNSYLNKMEDGLLKGERDAISYITFNKESTMRPRRDGASLQLNIPLKLQKNIEVILDIYKEKITCDEIIVSIMDSRTGRVLSLASSNRFDPENILQKNIPDLNVNAIEYQYEPGSVIKPIAIALALDHNRVQDGELFDAHNQGKKNAKGKYPQGKYKIDRHWIKDDHQFEKNHIDLEDIFVYSSNIGTLTLAQRLSAVETKQGYENFGFTQKTGIDLPYEKTGKLPPLYKLRAGEDEGKDNVYKATISYGHGMMATFMQILKAYTTFNNDGKIVTPKIVDTITHKNQSKKIPLTPPTQIIRPQTAHKIKELLITTVKKGTGKKALTPGIEVGGKTGTANIARGGRYQRKYMSSFFGFANDATNRYTIGVSVRNPPSRGKNWYYYYASESAVPVFKEIVKVMIKLDYLKTMD